MCLSDGPVLDMILFAGVGLRDEDPLTLDCVAMGFVFVCRGTGLAFDVLIEFGVGFEGASLVTSLNNIEDQKGTTWLVRMFVS